MSATINAEIKLNGDEDPSLEVEDDDVEEVGETGATGTLNAYCTLCRSHKWIFHYRGREEEEKEEKAKKEEASTVRPSAYWLVQVLP